MCIRDSPQAGHEPPADLGRRLYVLDLPPRLPGRHCCCLLYTSDAADERSSVDLGGRRIIKKKKVRERGRRHMS